MGFTDGERARLEEALRAMRRRGLSLRPVTLLALFGWAGLEREPEALPELNRLLRRLLAEEAAARGHGWGDPERCPEA